MARETHPSGSTLSTPERERHNAERVESRICAMDAVHGDDLPFAAVVATITSPAHGNNDYPRGRWQSGVPLCQGCADRMEQGLPFGHFMVDRVLPELCPECGVLAPCADCPEDQQPQ